jgi:DNA-directed RNA polymerase specialized sigma subunit
MTMFNTNKDREAYWIKMSAQYTGNEINNAVSSLKTEAQIVLSLHYGEGKDFKIIAELMHVSISVIRHYHNRSIYKLYLHFNPAVIENIKLLMSNA